MHRRVLKKPGRALASGDAARALEAALREARRAGRGTVELRADRAVRYARVREAMAAAGAAEYPGVELIAEKRPRRE